MYKAYLQCKKVTINANRSALSPVFSSNFQLSFMLDNKSILVK